MSASMERTRQRPPVVPDAQDLSKAVELAPVGVEVEVAPTGAGLSRQVKRWAARNHAADGMKIDDGLLEPQEVLRREPTADVDVLCRKRHAVGHRSKPFHDDELDLALDEAVEERLKVRHAGTSSAAARW
jgi:hypothetical protein